MIGRFTLQRRKTSPAAGEFLISRIRLPVAQRPGGGEKPAESVRKHSVSHEPSALCAVQSAVRVGLARRMASSLRALPAGSARPERPPPTSATAARRSHASGSAHSAARPHACGSAHAPTSAHAAHAASSPARRS